MFSPRPTDPAADPPKILVVDDSSTIRMLVRRCLVAEGFDVALASDGTRALSAAMAIRFDLLVVDVIMPIMDGVELIAQLRKCEAYAQTPMFVLSVDAGRAVVERGAAAGVTAWMLKPLNTEALVRGVRHVLGIPVALTLAR